MYARLWWKDARQLWPIWVFLAVTATVGQWLAPRFGLSAHQHTALATLALMWASLYAVASGAAAFAGEREAGTLLLLDIMPVKRRVVWAGKVSFALLTTLVLIGLLLAMAALSAKGRMSSDSVKSLNPRDLISLATIVLEALGWGLFWSALLSSALSAAVAAIFCTSISWIFLRVEFDSAGGVFTDAQRQFGIWRFGIALITVGASYILFRRRGLPRAPRRLWIELRSPIVVTWMGSPHPSEVRLQPPVATALLPAVQARAPRLSSMGDAALVPSWRGRRAWLLEAWALVWETAREGSKTWLWLAVAVTLLFAAIVDAGSGDVTFLVLADVGIALVAGVSVFGLENRAGTQRFLNYHAARPGLVWLVKLATWCLGLAAISVLQFVWIGMLPHLGLRQSQTLLIGLLAALMGFAMAQLCGMAIRRGITALVAALVLTLTLAIPLLAGVFALTVPPWGLPVLAGAFLVVSWAWRRDWLQSRPAPGRWLRLGLLLLGAMSSVFAVYVGYRVLSVPDASLVAAPAGWVEAAPPVPPPQQDAAELYREAGRRLNIRHVSQAAEYVKQNAEVLELIRRAAARPACWLGTLNQRTPTGELGLASMDRLAELVMLDAGECQKQGNLSGAWDDILLLFHMARHLSDGATTTGSLAAWGVEHDALGLAMEWAVAPKQTPERLRAALAAYGALSGMVRTSDVVRADANLIQHTLELPVDELRNRLLSTGRGERWLPAWVSAITFPWEIARARRVNRALAAQTLKTAAQEPYQRLRVDPSLGQFSVPYLEYLRQSTPLADLLIADLAPCLVASDRNEVGRRAVVQVLALRIWQLEHGGRFPDHLDLLVPGELSSLPDDPYTGRPFRYVRSEGPGYQNQRVTPGSWLSATAEKVVGSNVLSQVEKDLAKPTGAEPSGKPVPEAWLLYSVGPDFSDDHGLISRPLDVYRRLYGQHGAPLISHYGIKFDIVFLIPPVGKDSTKPAASERK